MTMVRMSVLIFGMLLVATTGLAVCSAEEEIWPNFSCLPTNSSVLQQRAFRYHRMGWRSCLESYKKYKGNCANLCVLSGEDILVLKVVDGPVIFQLEKFTKFLARELGYTVNGTAGPEQELMSKVQSNLEACKLKHPEYEKLTSLRKSECEPWKNFLKCFDEAIGCPVTPI